MSNLVKFSDLLPSSYYFLVLKILSILSLVLTIFLPIFEIHYVGSGFDALLTYFSLSSTTKINQGSASSIPTTFGNLYAKVVFLVALGCVLIALVVVFVKQNQVSELFDILGLMFIFTFILNYLLIYEENGQFFTNIKLNMTFDIGFYLVVISFLFLLASSFFKFKVKNSSTIE